MQNIVEICRQLAAEGKTPSVGLVKARAGKQVPLPSIIQAVQQWRQNPEVTLPNTAPNLHSATGHGDTIEHKKIAELEQRVSLLESQLESVVASVKSLTLDKR
ncbi:MAG: hypothetical protein ACFHVJ_19870 [Aestuariibacter sp.]